MPVMSLIVRPGLAQGYDKGLNKGLNMVAGKGVSEEGFRSRILRP